MKTILCLLFVITTLVASAFEDRFPDARTIDLKTGLLSEPATINRIEVSPDTLDFGYVEEGSSKTLTLLLTNVYNNENFIYKITYSYYVDEFEFVNFSLPYTMEPYSKNEIKVFFKPNIKKELFITTLKLENSSSETPILTVVLKGSSLISELSTNSSTIDFGIIKLHTFISSLDPINQVITNTGEIPITIDSAFIVCNESIFSLVTNLTNKTLNPGEEVSLELNCSGDKIGIYDCILTIYYNHGQKLEIHLKSEIVDDTDIENPVNTGNTISMKAIPNPITKSSVLYYSINSENPLPVSIKIIDISGNTVANLIKDVLQIGDQNIEINGENLPSGKYFVVITAGKVTHSLPVVIVK